MAGIKTETTLGREIRLAPDTAMTSRDLQPGSRSRRLGWKTAKETGSVEGLVMDPWSRFLQGQARRSDVKGRVWGSLQTDGARFLLGEDHRG